MVRQVKSTLTGITVLNGSTERDVVNATGALYQLGTEITSTAAELNKLDGVTKTMGQINTLLQGGNAASPTGTYTYKLIVKAATTRNASRKWRIRDLKNIVHAGHTMRLAQASVSANKPGAPAISSWFQTNASQTGAGATLRMHFMGTGGAAATGDNVRITIFAVGTV